MKRNFIFSAILLVVCLFTNAQIKVKSNGFIGLGTTTPSNCIDLHSNGTTFSFVNTGSYDASSFIIDRYSSTSRFYPFVNHNGYLGMNSNFWQYAYVDYISYTYTCTKYSDKRFKKNIKSLTKSLDKVLLLSGIEYDLDFTSIGGRKDMDEKHGKNQFGLIAQDVLKVVPEIVLADSNGYYSIDYINLIPLLIEAIKEQNNKIVALADVIKKQSKSAESSNDVKNVLGATLSQNVPNPFNENTTIKFYLPTTVQSVLFCIYDMQGKQIKSIIVTEREESSVIIHASELQPGMYYYSLIADGNVIGTEKMILTE
jgi:hypothetical protein